VASPTGSPGEPWTGNNVDFGQADTLVVAGDEDDGSDGATVAAPPFHARRLAEGCRPRHCISARTGTAVAGLLSRPVLGAGGRSL
jgi:hypothetical protein